LKARLAEIAAWIDSHSVQERVLLLATCLIGFFVFGKFVLMDPLWDEHKGIETALHKFEGEVRTLRVKNESILAAGANAESKRQREQRDLERQIEVLDARIQDHTVSMIPPTEMARFLEELLSEGDGLRLVRLENLEPEPVLEDRAEADATNAGLFKHGFVIELHGRYLSTLRYLRALEELPWDFFWDAIEYEVLEYPVGKVTIRAFTLSSERGWVGV
jgi:MSHA biogenesis protein MshJ